MFISTIRRNEEGMRRIYLEYIKSSGHNLYETILDEETYSKLDVLFYGALKVHRMACIESNFYKIVV